MTAGAGIAGAQAPAADGAARAIGSVCNHLDGSASVGTREKAVGADLVPLEEAISPFCCRDCGDPLPFGRVFAISDSRRAFGKRAVRGGWDCAWCATHPRVVAAAASVSAPAK
jgi:hypothetical protein